MSMLGWSTAKGAWSRRTAAIKCGRMAACEEKDRASDTSGGVVVAAAMLSLWFMPQEGMKEDGLTCG